MTPNRSSQHHIDDFSEKTAHDETPELEAFGASDVTEYSGCVRCEFNICLFTKCCVSVDFQTKRSRPSAMWNAR